MTAKLGRVSACLAEPISHVGSDLVNLIVENINPPAPVTPDDVYVRAMYIVSDEVNSLGGRFPVDEHATLVEQLVDSPVLVGHRKDKLPLARTFHAEQVTRDGVPWVKSYFYWSRSADGAESLLENIDAGVYKECSIGFTFFFAECSICGKDIRLCPHEPFEEYGDDKSGQPCHFNYRKIERVLETSLVYRGATLGTAMTRNLDADDDTGRKASQPESVPLISIDSLSELPPANSYLILPRYDALVAELAIESDRLIGRLCTGTELAAASRKEQPTGDNTICILPARLVGMRGKERCSREYLSKFLAGERSPVTRAVLFVLPTESGVESLPGRLNDRIALKVIPSRRSSLEDLPDMARDVATKHGVEVWTLDADQQPASGFALAPEKLHAPPDSPLCTITMIHGKPDALLKTSIGDTCRTFLIHQFHAGRLNRGFRFLADECRYADEVSPAAWKAAINDTHEADGAWMLDLSGGLSGRFILRPIRLEGKRRLVFYRLGAIPSGGDTA